MQKSPLNGRLTSVVGAACCKHGWFLSKAQQEAFSTGFFLSAELLTGFSLTPERAGCVRPVLPEREAWISLRIHTDSSRLLQDLYCPLAVTQLLITGHQTPSVLTAGAMRGTASSKMYKTALKPAENIQGCFEMLGNEPWIPAFHSVPMAGAWESLCSTRTLTADQRAIGKVGKIGELPLHGFVFPIHAGTSTIILCALLEEPSEGLVQSSPNQLIAWTTVLCKSFLLVTPKWYQNQKKPCNKSAHYRHEGNFRTQASHGKAWGWMGLATLLLRSKGSSHKHLLLVRQSQGIAQLLPKRKVFSIRQEKQDSLDWRHNLSHIALSPAKIWTLTTATQRSVRGTGQTTIPGQELHYQVRDALRHVNSWDLQMWGISEGLYSPKKGDLSGIVGGKRIRPVLDT